MSTLADHVSPAPRALPVADVPSDVELDWLLSDLADCAGADGAALFRQGAGTTADLLAVVGTARALHDGVGPWGLVASRIAPRELADRTGDSGPLLYWCDDARSSARRLLAIYLPQRHALGFVLTLCFTGRGGTQEPVVERLVHRRYPALSAYLKLWSRQDSDARLRAALEGALDAQGVGIGIVDGQGDIVFMNRAMRQITELGDTLRQRGRRLMAADLNSAVRLQVAIAHVQSGETDDAAMKAPLVALRRIGREGRLLAVVIPPSTLASPIVAINVLNPDSDGAAGLRPICALHGLRPAETEIVGHLAQGATLAEIAVRMRLKESTARTYLKQIFVKTGTGRQADLVRLILTSALRLHESISPVVL